MNFYIQQAIHINILRVNAISNSSVLQIGSSGIIKSRANIYNTGGYTENAPEIPRDGFKISSTYSTPEIALPVAFRRNKFNRKNSTQDLRK